VIWISELLQPIPTIDVVVFDVDGVLIDDTVSYYAAVKATVSHVLSRVYRRSGADSLVTDADIMAFKSAGGFNDDWVLAYTLSGLLLAAPAGTRPPLARIAAQSAGRGMPWIREQYFAELDLDQKLVDAIGREYYWGTDLLQDRLGRASQHYHGVGFVRQEQPLIPAGFFEELRSVGVRRFGVITGRDDIELQRVGDAGAGGRPSFWIRPGLARHQQAEPGCSVAGRRVPGADPGPVHRRHGRRSAACAQLSAQPRCDRALSLRHGAESRTVDAL
jgi:hypothetical protein